MTKFEENLKSASAVVRRFTTAVSGPCLWLIVSLGIVHGTARRVAAAVATPAESITTLPGFKVERLHSTTTAESSLICMTFDNKGRIIASPQDGLHKFHRFTIGKDGQIEKSEPLDVKVKVAMGMLWAFDSLYVNADGPNGYGLYRLRDTQGNDQFDEVKFLKEFKGNGEHGPHGLALGPDNKIYVMNGNHTRLPEGLSTNSPYSNYAEDMILPRQWDANGHATGILAPGGYVVRTDADGKNWELVLGGFRNAYGIDFNSDGELFTFDSDMEWDWGTPWYRPTRINHCVSGAEFGWRSGTYDWPAYYFDSLPATIDIGIGSPTGVRFGTKSNFPEKYKRALYIMDWSYGRIMAVHLSPKGASYSATMETLLRGKPLNVTSMEFGPDGALYFVTGGRATQSGIYRVTSANPETQNPKSETERSARDAIPARALRHQLEAFHGKTDPQAVAFAWPYLNNSDPFIRFAARVAIESQDINTWKDRALAENDLDAFLEACLAVARRGDRNVQTELLTSMERIPKMDPREDQILRALRVLEVCFARMGKPNEEFTEGTIKNLAPNYPSKNEWLNRELCQLLVYLDAPDVIANTLALLDAAPTQEEQLHYILCLRTVRHGWTLEQRKRYFSWFNQNRALLKHPENLVQWFKDVGLTFYNGNSFNGFLQNIKREALSLVPDAEKAQLSAIIAGTAVPFKPSVQRSNVKQWAVADFASEVDGVLKGRSFEKGKIAFQDAQCLACHQFRGEGGGVGPDLTAVSSRFSRKDILESIIEPSKVVSEQFQNSIIEKRNGEQVIARILENDNGNLQVSTDPLKADRVTISRRDVANVRPSKSSPMPDGLLNVFEKEEILDLLAYVESGGNPESAVFRK